MSDAATPKKPTNNPNNSNPSKKIDIFINGHSYGINCPASEEENLKRAATYIQQFIQDIRKQAPSIAQEELLVLCALNLYEKSEALQQHLEQENHAKTLVTAMLKDAQALTNP